jgi:hypothetical protein
MRDRRPVLLYAAAVCCALGFALLLATAIVRGTSPRERIARCHARGGILVIAADNTWQCVQPIPLTPMPEKR